MKQYIHFFFLSFGFLFLMTCNAAVEYEGLIADDVINILNHKFDMFNLLQDIAEVLRLDSTIRLTDGQQLHMRIEFDYIINQIVLQKTVVRDIDMMCKEKEDKRSIICQLAISKTLYGSSECSATVSNEVAAMMSDIRIQAAAQIVSSFAVSIAYAHRELMPEETTESYVLRLFITIFRIAENSNIIQRIPALLEADMHFVDDIVATNEVIEDEAQKKCCVIA